MFMHYVMQAIDIADIVHDTHASVYGCRPLDYTKISDGYSPYFLQLA